MLIILEIKTNQNQAKSNEGGDNALGRYKRSEIDLNSRIMKRNSAQFRQMLIIYFNPNPVPWSLFLSEKSSVLCFTTSKRHALVSIAKILDLFG